MKIVKFQVKKLESIMIGLVVVFAILTVFGTIAGDIADGVDLVVNGEKNSSGHYITSGMTGGSVFSIVGILITIGVLLVVMKGVMGKR